MNIFILPLTIEGNFQMLLRFSEDEATNFKSKTYKITTGHIC